MLLAVGPVSETFGWPPREPREIPLAVGPSVALSPRAQSHRPVADAVRVGAALIDALAAPVAAGDGGTVCRRRAALGGTSAGGGIAEVRPHADRGGDRHRHVV